ncbi:STAS domain-containing protein [Psychrobacillus sp. NEAU-3TGS]|uniref:STAS domain-containing protein n=1 Tax=Psychrobacillus sp. NEAU-3TGS TaxID=2995412 RepID=UPI002496B9E0|nr:STAS domain-containing protein [Psychrobacillus sp. NEAU-3TGS]MDI2587518.1 STAS domain-containing protein [Psychrobacillus sp. NEAU-3TGS]
MEEVRKVGRYLIDNAEIVIRDITKKAIINVDIPVTEEMLEHSIQQNVEFLVLIAQSFEESEETAEAELIKWSKQVGEQQAALFSQFSTILKPFAKNRLLYLECITQISIDHGLSVENVVKINNRINYLMDVSLMETISAYEVYRDSLMEERQKEINELSAPIVPIQTGVAVLPLIGMIDSYRFQYVINHLVPLIPSRSIDHLIIDFSGILTIDSEVAEQIFILHSVLQLLGIHVLFSGIRPNLSMEVVRAGIDFSSFQTFGSVKQAIDSLK